MKKSALIITILCLSLLSGCTGSSQNELSSQPETSAGVSQASAAESGEPIHTIKSGPDTPLSLQEWGLAGKFSVASQDYCDVPVRIISVLRGKAAEKAIQALSSTSPLPEKDPALEYVMVTYEIDLDGFPVDSRGITTQISAAVTAKDGDYISNGKEKLPTPTANLTDDVYYYEGIHSGYIVFQLPPDCKDYRIVLGEYGETQAYIVP